MLEKIKKAVKKVEEAAERNGITIDIIEIRDEVTLGEPYNETFPPSASIYAGREILVYIHRNETIYTLISKNGDTIRRYKVAAAALVAAQKLSMLDGEL